MQKYPVLHELILALQPNLCILILIYINVSLLKSVTFVSAM
jgi:hypothetical protein